MDEKAFFQEILKNESIWVAMQKNEVLTLTDSEGISDLPVWISREMASDYISAKADESLEPVEIPLDTFERLWAAEGVMDFNELVLNPNAADSTHSVISKSEFLENTQG